MNRCPLFRVSTQARACLLARRLPVGATGRKPVEMRTGAFVARHALITDTRNGAKCRNG